MRLPRYFLPLLIFFGASAALCSQHFVNPDFEDPEPGRGWELGENSRTVAVGQEESSPNHALLLGGDGGNNFSQLVSLRPDSLSLYQLSFRVRTREVSDGSRGFLWVNVLDADTTMILETGLGHFVGDTDWKTESYTFLAPVATRALRMGGTLTGRGQLWFDDFVLRELPLREDSVRLSPEAEDYIGAVLDTLETYAVNRTELDFDYIRQSIHYAARGAVTPSDTYGAIRQGVQMLHDRRHSQLFTRDELTEMLGGIDIREMLTLEVSSRIALVTSGLPPSTGYSDMTVQHSPTSCRE